MLLVRTRRQSSKLRYETTYVFKNDKSSHTCMSQNWKLLSTAVFVFLQAYGDVYEKYLLI